MKAKKLASRPPRRFLSVYLPTWATDRITRRLLRRDARDKTSDRSISLRGASSGSRGAGAAFIFLAATSNNQRIVAACCEASLRMGVRAGMSVAHATALLPRGARLELGDHAPMEDAAALLALARWAVRFSPVTGPDYPDGLLLDVSGCQRLYGSDEALGAKVAQSLGALGLDARVGIAPTIGAAWAVSRFAVERRMGGLMPLPAARMRPVARNFASVSMPVDHAGGTAAPGSQAPSDEAVLRWRVVNEDEWPELFPRMPIAALRVEDKIVDELAEVGIDHVGQLLCIPRDEIASRFDADLLLRIDQATGEALEVLQSVRHEEPPTVLIRFAGPTTQFEAIELAVRHLVDELCAKLLKREAGARKLVLEIERLDEEFHRQWGQETLTLSRPSRNAKHIWNLLRPRIERLHLGEGVDELSMTARTAPLPHEQERFDGTSDESEDATSARLKEAAGQLVDLLESRLGASAVLVAKAVETHIPEAAFQMRPAGEGGLKIAPLPQAAGAPTLKPGRIEPGASIAGIGTTTAQITSMAVPPHGDRPTVLFEKPEPAAVTLLQPEGPVIGLQWHRLHRIRAAIGPERIGRRWWHFAWSRRQPARDYYRLQDDDGLWLWVYRSRYSRRWFVHGVWG